MRQNLKYLVLFLLCINAITATAQTEINFPKKTETESTSESVDLSGLWEAEISQQNWNGKPEFRGVTGRLHVEITHSGSNISGLLVCRAKFADNHGYLSYEKSFTGKWDGKKVNYRDLSVENYINTHKTLSHVETCMKTAILDYYTAGDKMYLEGEWAGVGHASGVPCIPRKIRLKKVREEDLAMEDAQTMNVNFEKKEGLPAEVKIKGRKIKKLRDRKVEDGHNIEVQSKSLSITVYDHQRDDGDIISLNYNGNWILQEYRISHNHHKLDIILKNDERVPDYLILFAHNLGEVSPNTVAVEIDDGFRVQRFILNSDMKTSDIIYFDCD